MMTGWKTWGAVILYGVGHALESMGYPEWGQLVINASYMLGTVGIAHKIEKGNL